jgi:hypothetical protein
MLMIHCLGSGSNSSIGGDAMQCGIQCGKPGHADVCFGG